MCDLRDVLIGSSELVLGVEAIHASEETGAFLRLYHHGLDTAAARIPESLWAATYEDVFGHLVPDIDPLRGRYCASLLLLALAEDGSLSGSAQTRSERASTLFSFLRRADELGNRNNVLVAAFALIERILAEKGIDYGERREMAFSELTDDEWIHLAASIGVPPAKFTCDREMSSVWVHSELTGANPDALLVRLGRGVRGWRSFCRSHLPYIRPALAEIARARLGDAGMDTLIACEDPRNQIDVHELIAVPVGRPTWIGRRVPSLERILCDLQRAAAELGEPLTEDDYAVWCLHRGRGDNRTPVSAVRKRFSTWRAACDAAGISCGFQVTSDEEMFVAMRHVSQLAGFEYLSSALYKFHTDSNSEFPSCSAIVLRFGDWSSACHAAGLPGPLVTDTDIILDGLRSAANGAPTLTESAYDSWRIDNGNVNAPASWAVRYRFGTWVHACEAAGLSGANGWSDLGGGDDVLITALRRVHEQIGEPLSMTSYERFRNRSTEHALPAVSTIIKRIGSWRLACDRAGVPTGTERCRQQIHDDELLAAIRAAAGAATSRLTANGYREWVAAANPGEYRPSMQPILDRFGTWSNACGLAGVHAAHQVKISGAAP